MKFSRRRFIYNAATGLMVPAVVRASVPIPFGFLSDEGILPAAWTALAAWLARVATAGGTVTGSDQLIVARFISGMMRDSLWDLAWRIGVYAGDFAALKAPLVNTAGATQDTLTAFVGGDYTSGGLTGGAGKRIETGLTPGNLPAGSTNNFSMCVYSRTATNHNGITMAASDFANVSMCFLTPSYGDSKSYGALWDAATQLSPSDSAGVGLYHVSRASSTSLVLYKNAVSLASTAVPSGVFSAFSIWVHDGNLNNTAWQFSNKQLSFYGVFQGMSAVQAGRLYNRVQAMQSAFGRAV